MWLFCSMLRYVKGWSDTENFYKAVNLAYHKMYGEYQFIHFPYFRKEGEDFIRNQKNLTDECLKPVLPLEGKKVLEVGCGNGMQAMYILDRYQPESYVGLDINASNLEIGKEVAKERGLHNITFLHGDAHELKGAEDNSLDVVLNIESAMHYKDKARFLKQIYRVLKPGGKFVVADVLSRTKRTYTRWDRKMHHLNWSPEQYQEGFAQSGLIVELENDITDEVVRGFGQYRHWFRETAMRNPLQKALIKYWAIAIFKFNARNLSTKNCYYIFAGCKPSV